jgi:competence protein ComEC
VPAAVFAAACVAVAAALHRRTIALAAALLFAAGMVIAATTPEPAPRWERPAAALEPVRSELGRRIDRVFRADAELARALLIADQRQIPLEVRDRFAASGLVHMLSIGGQHVSIIAGSIELLLLALRFGRAFAVWGSVLLIFAYVAVLDWNAPALRAAIMYGTLSAARGIQRPTSPWAALALGAWIPLVSPRTIQELGYQLTICGMVAIIAAGALARRLPLGEQSPFRARIVRELLGSALASLTTMPLVAWYFGRVSMVGPVANLAAGPVITVLQPTLFLGLALSWFEPAAEFVGDAAHPLARTFDAIAAAAASLPFAALDIAPTLLASIALAVAAAGVVVACSARRPARPLLVAAVALATVAWSPLLPARHRDVELHVLDVGQGDAVALRTNLGNWVLFDAGRSWRTGDAGRAVVVPYVRRRGGDVLAFVLSHPHMDHVGGAASVVRWLRPPVLWDPAYVAAARPYADALRAAARSRTDWKRVHPGSVLRADGVEVRFLAPDSAWIEGLRDANEASAVALVTYGRVRFLLTGDTERAGESWLLANARELLDVDVLKVAHHGSSTSSAEDFIAAATPRLALVSVGADNAYGHPSVAVMERFARRNVPVLRTDLDGTLVVRTDGTGISVHGGGGKWVLPRESPAY